MSDYLIVLAFTAMPALGNFAGGLLAEIFRVSQRTLSLALHLAAGIIIAVVAVELIPQSFETDPKWAVILAFVGGAIFFVGVDRLIGRLNQRGEETGAGNGPWDTSPYELGSSELLVTTLHCPTLSWQVGNNAGTRVAAWVSIAGSDGRFAHPSPRWRESHELSHGRAVVVADLASPASSGVTRHRRVGRLSPASHAR